VDLVGPRWDGWKKQANIREVLLHNYAILDRDQWKE